MGFGEERATGLDSRGILTWPRGGVTLIVNHHSLEVFPANLAVLGEGAGEHVNLTVLEVGIASGIGRGSVYALIALSFSLIIASTGFFVFAFESVVSLGGIVAYVLVVDHGVPIVLAGVIVCLVGALLGVLLDFIVHRPFERRNLRVDIAVLLASIGVAIAVDAIVGRLFGGTPRFLPPYINPAPIFLGSAPIQRPYIVMLVSVLVVIVALEIVFRRTSVGRDLRAIHADREGAALLGQNVARTATVIFAISGFLAAGAGFLITPVTSASALAGSSMIVPVFAALAIGGFASFRGSIVGGLVVGLISGVLPIYIAAYLVPIILFAVIVLALLIRPQGLFSPRAARQL